MLFSPLAGVRLRVVAWPLATVNTSPQALSMLMLGWDHAVHFTMYLEQRFAQAAPPFLPPAPDGGSYAYATYPRWFHSLAVVIAEAAYGQPVSVAQELVRYSHVQWGLFSLLVVAVTAAVLQSLDRASASRVTASSLLALSLLVAVPGGLNLLQGHLSFLFAAVAPPLIYLLSRSKEASTLPEVAAISGLLVLAASWMLVLPMAMVAAWPAARRALTLRSPTQRAVMAILLVACVAFATLLVVGSFAQLPTSSGPAQSGAAAVVLDGPVIALSPWAIWTLLGLSWAISLVWWFRGTRSSDDPLAVVMFTTVALSMSVAIAAYQLAATGQLTYYFWKFTLAAVLGVGLVMIAAWPSGRPVRDPGIAASPKAVRTGVLTVLVPSLALLGLGVALRDSPAPSVFWAGGVHQLFDERSRKTSQANLLLRTSAALDPSRATRTTLMATREGDPNASYAQQWFHTLARARFGAADRFDVDLFALSRSEQPSESALAVDIARRALEDPDGELLVTDPRLMARLSTLLSTEELSRVRLVDR